MRSRQTFGLLALSIVAFAFVTGAVLADEKSTARIVRQVGHSSGVEALAVAADEKFALSGGGDGLLKLWDVGTGRLLRDLPGHKEAITAVAFFPSGGKAVDASFDNTLTVWDLETGVAAKVITSDKPGEIDAVAVSPDGRFVLSAACEGGPSEAGLGEGPCDHAPVVLWDASSWKQLRRRNHGTLVDAIAFAPNSTSAVFAGGHTGGGPEADYAIVLWDVANWREIRRYTGHRDRVRAVSFSSDGKLLVSASSDGTVRLWDVASGREKRRLGKPGGGTIISVGISPDSAFAFAVKRADECENAASCTGLTVWSAATGDNLVEVKNGVGGKINVASFVAAGRLVLTGSSDGVLQTWDAKTGQPVQAMGSPLSGAATILVAADGRSAVSAGETGAAVVVDLKSGLRRAVPKADPASTDLLALSADGEVAVRRSRNGSSLSLLKPALGESRTVPVEADGILSAALSADGKHVLLGQYAGSGPTIALWDAQTAKKVRHFTGFTGQARSLAFSPVGGLALSGGCEVNEPDDYCAMPSLRLWDVATGREVKKLTGHKNSVRIVTFSRDGKLAASGDASGGLKVWKLTEARETVKLAGHTGMILAAAFAPDASVLVTGGDDKTLKLWSMATGAMIGTFAGHTNAITSVAFSDDGERIISSAADDTIRVWDRRGGHELAAVIVLEGGNQLAITRDGFFTSTKREVDSLDIVRGFEPTAIGQLRQSLFNPDLVREALAGDTSHEVEKAAKVVSLDKVLDSGPAPSVKITSHPPGSKSGTDLVAVTARIDDRGRGIGRIEWRVNGITAGVTTGGVAGPDAVASRTLALDPGENTIEVVAYNATNMLASLPARTTIALTEADGTAAAIDAKLFVLSIGINAYADPGWIEPSTGKRELFPPLEQSVTDARSIAEAMERAGADQYRGGVRVTLALDQQATVAGLDEIMERIGAEATPRDTFVLFAAAHGYSNEKGFYLIPFGYQGGSSPEALNARAIDQAHLQNWIANRISARKAIVLLDTCRSGALTNGYAHAQVSGAASESAIGRLHEATGRPVLTATAANQDAWEIGALKHGIFTYAVLDALHHAGRPGDGVITVFALATYVQDLLPRLGPDGKTRAVTRTRGPEESEQSARFGTTGDDFPLAKQIP